MRSPFCTRAIQHNIDDFAHELYELTDDEIDELVAELYGVPRKTGKKTI